MLRQPIWCAILSLSLNTAAYGSEILRGGLRAVPPGAIEAARVCGMSRALMYRRIILPIAMRQALPAYGSEVIIMVKSTSLASIITLMEVTGIAQEIISTTYRSFEVFTCAAAIYLTVNFVLARFVLGLERWLQPGGTRAA
jgi:octopine/nopaline transport system permease protein